MNIIEQATRRMEALQRAGVEVPWNGAGLADGAARPAAGSQASLAQPHSTRTTAIRLHDAQPARIEARIESVTPRPRVVAAAASPPVITTLDLARLERCGYLVPSQTRSVLSEEFRQIKRPLLRNARAKGAAEQRLSLIMVTSALAGEGKTFCAINLAMSMAAEIDTSVLLVDADVLRPGVLSRLGIQADKGLLDVLTQPRLALSDVILKTNVPKLSVLPAGTPNAMATELLASEAMEELLLSLAATHPDRVVIFDTPPLLVTNEARVLATRVGQVVLVVEALNTRCSAVAQAFAALEQCPVVMSVLNKALEPAAPLGYGYGHA